MGDERWDAGEDFLLRCADFKMSLRSTDGELSLIRQLFVGSQIRELLVLNQLIFLREKRCMAGRCLSTSLPPTTKERSPLYVFPHFFSTQSENLVLVLFFTT